MLDQIGKTIDGVLSFFESKDSQGYGWIVILILGLMLLYVVYGIISNVR